MAPATVGPVNLSFLFIAAWMFDGLAGIALPFFRKNLFENAPPITKKKIGGVPLVSLLGLYAVVLLVAMFIAALANPVAVGAFSEVTIGTIIVALALGLIFYFGMKAYHARRGMDISLVFKEVPPE